MASLVKILLAAPLEMGRNFRNNTRSDFDGVTKNTITRASGLNIQLIKVINISPRHK